MFAQRPRNLLEAYMEPLVAGCRQDCRKLVFDALREGAEPRSLYPGLLWPAMEKVDELYRSDRINTAAQNMATRINRVMADQIQFHLPEAPKNGRRVLITCTDGEAEELGAQMCADLFESDGWEVIFLGGGVPNDEVLELVGKQQPDLLLIFGCKPQDAPAARQLITDIRGIGAAPRMNIMVSGGVFNRALGLWKEIKADLFAETAIEALDVANRAEPAAFDPPAPGAPKKRRRRRPPPLLANNMAD